jgi:hypothetical protein
MTTIGRGMFAKGIKSSTANSKVTVKTPDGKVRTMHKNGKMAKEGGIVGPKAHARNLRTSVKSEKVVNRVNTVSGSKAAKVVIRKRNEEAVTFITGRIADN